MQHPIFSVTELNNTARALLEQAFPDIIVEGEISNFSAPRSGHWYFSLKDTHAQVRCAMFKFNSQTVNFTPANGMQVQLKVRVSLYGARGDFQCIVQDMTEVGTGKLKIAYDKLLQKLAAQGLFQQKHKQPIPTLPKKLGVITSPTGAAIHDILTVLKRRFPALPVVIYPTQVQGATATQQIINAIEAANQHNACDLILLSRGGGSLEDLWCFNEESVAHAIFESKLPVITGIGHEVDTTIADLVADQRAPTPSAAAELITPDRKALLDQAHNLFQRLQNNILRSLQDLAQQLDWLHKRLRHPKDRIIQIEEKRQHLTQKLIQLMQQKQKENKHNLITLATKLNAISPLATLSRGYAIVTKGKNNKVVTSVKSLKSHDKLTITLADGKLNCLIE